MELHLEDEEEVLFMHSSPLENWETLVVTFNNSARNCKLMISIDKYALFNEKARRKDAHVDHDAHSWFWKIEEDIIKVVKA